MSSAGSSGAGFWLGWRPAREGWVSLSLLGTAQMLQSSAHCPGKAPCWDHHSSDAHLEGPQSTAWDTAPLSSHCIPGPSQGDLLVVADLELLSAMCLLSPCAVWTCFTGGGCCLSRREQQRSGCIRSRPGTDGSAGLQHPACGRPARSLSSARRSHPFCPEKSLRV